MIKKKNKEVQGKNSIITKIFKKFKFAVPLILLFFLFFQTSMASYADSSNLIEDAFVYFVWDILFQGAWMFMYIAGIVFDNFLGLTLSTSFYNQDFIKILWTSLRDFANIAFILGLVYIAISIMLQDAFNTKGSLVKLIVIALLINFSFFFTRVIIDAGNITGIAFYSSLSIKQKKADDDKYMMDIVKNNPILAGKSISAGVAAATGIKANGPTDISLFKNKTGKRQSSGGMIVVGLFYAFFFYQFGKSFLIAAFGFLSRTIWLVIYMLFSPLAFVAYFLPGKLNEYYKEWWDGLINRSFGIAIYLVMIYIIFEFVRMDLLVDAGTVTISGSTTVPDTYSMVLPLVIKGMIMWTLIESANKLSVKFNENGSSLFAKVFEKVAAPALAFTGGAVIGASKAGAKKVIGRQARNFLYDSDGKISKWVRDKSRNGNIITRNLADATLIGVEKINNAKFGTGSSYHDDSTAARERQVKRTGLRDMHGGEEDGANKLYQAERSGRKYKQKDENGREFVDFAKTKEGEEAKKEYEEFKKKGITILKDRAIANEEKIQKAHKEIDSDNQLSDKEKEKRKERETDKLREEFRKKNYFDSNDIQKAANDVVLRKNADAIIGNNIENVKFEKSSNGMEKILQNFSVNYAASTEQTSIEKKKQLQEREKNYISQKKREQAAEYIEKTAEKTKQEFSKTAEESKKSLRKNLYEGEDGYDSGSGKWVISEDTKKYISLNNKKDNESKVLRTYIEEIKNGDLSEVYIDNLEITDNEKDTLRTNQSIIKNKNKVQDRIKELNTKLATASEKDSAGIQEQINSTLLNLSQIKESEKETLDIVNNHFNEKISAIDNDIKIVKKSLDAEFKAESGAINDTLKQRKAGIEGRSYILKSKLKAEGEIDLGSESVYRDMLAMGHDVEHISQVGHAVATPEQN